MGSFSNTPNFDNLLIQTLTNRLRPQTTATSSSPSSFLNQTLEDLLFDNLNISSDQTSSDDDENDQTSLNPSNTKTQLAKEEARLEKSIVKTILSGNTEALKPNSGQAVTINDHHICVGYHQEDGSAYRVWEWHGHIMLFDDDNGYSPEYIYGNYFERVRENVAAKGDDREREEREDDEEKVGSLGLRELIGLGDDLGSARILHRSLNAGSPRYFVALEQPHRSPPL